LSASINSTIYGGLGKVFQTKPRSEGIYANFIHKSGEELVPNSLGSVATNGIISFGDPTQTVYDHFLAEWDSPAFPIPVIVNGDEQGNLENLNYRASINAFMTEAYDDKPFKQSPNIHKLLKFRTGKTGLEDSTNTKPVDLLAQTWPEYEGKGILSFANNEFTHLLTEEYELHDILNNIMLWSTTVIRATKPPRLTWGYGGYANISAGPTPKASAHPSFKVKFGDEWEAEVRSVEEPDVQRDLAWTSFWLELAASQIEKKWRIDGYRREDYLAIAWQLIKQISGTGFVSKPDKLPINADSIFDSVVEYIGDNTNKIAFFRLGIKDYEEYLELKIVLKIAAMMIKAPLLHQKMYLTRGDKKAAVNTLRDLFTADYEDFGSNSSPFWIMAKSVPLMDYWLPSMIDVNSLPNLWKRLPPKTGTVWGRASVEHGEIKESVLEPMDQKATNIILNTTANDARRWEITYTDHKSIIWLFPHHGVADKISSQEGKWQSFFMNEISGAPTTYKRGWKMSTTLAIITAPGFVTMTGIIGATGPIVQKTQTEAESTTGNQMLTPQKIVAPLNKADATPEEKKSNIPDNTPPKPEIPAQPTSAVQPGSNVATEQAK